MRLALLMSNLTSVGRPPGTNEGATRASRKRRERRAMDGLTRLMALTAQDRAYLAQRRADEAFRAWHRLPDARLDEPAGLRPDRGPVRRLARLVARIGTA